MDNEIKIVTKFSYGHKRIYPGNVVADIFCALCKSRCISEFDLDLIKTLGFRVVEINGDSDEQTPENT